MEERAKSNSRPLTDSYRKAVEGPRKHLVSVLLTVSSGCKRGMKIIAVLIGV